MKKILLLLCMIAAVHGFSQKTVHDANAVTRSGKGFHAIDVSGGIDLYLSQGNEEAIAVSASSSEYRDKIVTEVVNGVLKIYYDSERRWSLGNLGNRKLKAYVSVKNIDKLHASGGSDVFIDNELTVASLVLEASGGSDVRGKIHAGKLDLSAHGGSDLYISGRADVVKVDVSGGSDLHGYDLVTGSCTVSCSGGSDVRITANKEMDAHASGGSDIYYKGTASLNSAKSGGGSVKRVD